MSRLTYNLGFALGIVVREFLRGANSSSPTPSTQPKVVRRIQLPPPCVPDSLLRDMDHQPAMVRSKGINLNHWYAANTREAKKTPRKRRIKTPTDKATPAFVGSVTPSAC